MQEVLVRLPYVKSGEQFRIIVLVLLVVAIIRKLRVSMVRMSLLLLAIRICEFGGIRFVRRVVVVRVEAMILLGRILNLQSDSRLVIVRGAWSVPPAIQMI